MNDKKKKNHRTIKCDFRMSEEELSDLSYMSHKMGKSKSEIIREALKMYNNLIKAK